MSCSGSDVDEPNVTAGSVAGSCESVAADPGADVDGNSAAVDSDEDSISFGLNVAPTE